MNSRRLALSGLLTALAVTVLLLGGVIPIAVFCAPMLAMAVLLPVLEEYGVKTAATAWAAAALLALFLVPDRETALAFAAYGWYPLVRRRLARLPSPVLRLAARAGIYTAVTLGLYGLILRLLGLTAELLEETWWMNCALFLLGGITFFMFDRALERLCLLWRHRLRRRFFRT